MRRPTRPSPAPTHVLVVDDERPIRLAIETLLRLKGYSYSSAATPSEAMAEVERRRPDLVIADLNLEQRDDGLDLVRAVRGRHPGTAILVMSGFGDGESAIAAMKAGAYDFIAKPFGSLGELEATIEAALAHDGLRALESGRSQGDPFEEIIGGDPGMLELFAMIRRLWNTDATVLLVGESGTGKELFARAIHASSQRRAGPFVPVNCGAIPESLLESELFGARKGAFTGASADRKGRFQAAERGTIFLDEIGDMPVALQVKLLRVLQSREIQPVGAPEPTSVDVRMVAATNIDLERAVREGRFREDLYYRLNVIPMRIPPLRERPADILELVHHFIAHFNRATGREIVGIDGEAGDLLLSYEWPGNVRELENVIERIVVLKGRGLIGADDLPMKIRGVGAGYDGRVRERGGGLRASSEVVARPARRGEAPLASLDLELTLPEAGIDLRRFVEHVEVQLIEAALTRAGGNRAEAARMLGLNRTTLVERLKRR